MEVQNFSAEQILGSKFPGDLFSKDTIKIKEELRRLLKLWHPDVNHDPISAEVFNHIYELYHLGISQLESGKWETPGLLEIGTNSNQFRVKYKKHFEFELGDCYIGDYIITYLIDKSYEDLFNNGRLTVNNFKYSSDRMKVEVMRYLPKPIRCFEIENKLGWVFEKTPDILSLRDVLNCYGGKLDPRHVAWIMSTLHNITCYLEYAGLSHNDISLDTYFISPKYHSGALLGGWWYATREGERLIAVPNRTYQFMSTETKASKIAFTKTDLELIRAIGRELLGDSTGIRLNQIEGIPKPLISWLQLPSPTYSAIKDYSLWQKVLTDSFGPRKFVKMELTSNELYK